MSHKEKPLPGENDCCQYGNFGDGHICAKQPPDVEDDDSNDREFLIGVFYGVIVGLLIALAAVLAINGQWG